MKKRAPPALRNHLAAALQSKLFRGKKIPSKKNYDRNKDKKVNENMNVINTNDESESK